VLLRKKILLTCKEVGTLLAKGSKRHRGEEVSLELRNLALSGRLVLKGKKKSVVEGRQNKDT